MVTNAAQLFFAKASTTVRVLSSVECHYDFQSLVCGYSWNFNLCSEEI